MAGLSYPVVLLVTVLAAREGTEKIETYPDGAKHLAYAVNEKGEKSGEFRELFPSGKPKVLATYHDDKLAGPYKEFGEDGKLAVVANYREGMLHGVRQEFAQGKLVREEMW